ncbi:16S rRNA (cytosine(1402)-N(4))-methyltransferase RsmH [bacterium]|nr:16S rRNA (cytosine(1402)-N(4))-methyltransferase RsmH [bacterium]MCB2179352.1 16S rRNA (cytosine(1402)-N(4))-methyltransferase RsmH [bacterium]
MNATTGGERLPHQPVLYQQIIPVIQPQRGGKYVDGTVGAGGHAWGLLNASSPDGLLLGLDVDPQALQLAVERLAEFGSRATLVHASHITLRQQLDQLGWTQVNGILLDLGASSMQFDSPDRGFSFLHDGPLDMRFNPHNPLTAADIVNSWDERSLADVIFQYGEERLSRRVAKAICKARPFSSTRQLAEVVADVVGNPPGSKLHPATRTFQALRIAVNQELDAIHKTLPQAVEALVPGGRLAVITFHSLEDRIVKNIFRDLSRELRDEQHPMAPVLRPPVVSLVQRKPFVPTEEEINQNPRARSAKLRVIEKL